MPVAGALLVADRDGRLARVGQAVPVAGVERNSGVRALDVLCERRIRIQSGRRRAGDRCRGMDLSTRIRAIRAAEERVPRVRALLSGAVDDGGLVVLPEENLREGLGVKLTCLRRLFLGSFRT